MNEHDHVIRLLPLVAAGDVTPDEIRLVQEHLSHCAQCRRAHEDYAFLGHTLRGLPVPQPSVELVQQVRIMAAPLLAKSRPANREAAVLAPLIAASWILALATWPWIRAAGSWMLTGWHVPGGNFTTALVVYSILGFVMASVAAIAVGRQAGALGRMR